MKNRNHSLIPVFIDPKTKQHIPVDKLRECLQNEEIYNVALTGPFGSGKSSVIKTLVKEEKDNYKFLEISLATLDAKGKGVIKEGKEEKEKVDDNQSKNGDNQSKVPNTDKKTPKEGTDAKDVLLSKKIEMGILQQLVYREEERTLPNSRFRRIHFFKEDELTPIVIMTLLAVLCIAVAFEPSFLKIDTLCRMFNLGDYNVWFDFIAMGYLFYFSWVLLHWLYKKYWGSKFSKLNLTDGEIEVKESGSIFNEHLEEIIYFFQATDYNVVILEDLDRFDNPLVYLKLRELNYLLKYSKVIKRRIVFVYSVKDDMFSDASRTKFFDYIIPVIPIMNMSNAEGLLKEELRKVGYIDIKDEDLSDIAGFIDDMRLLYNIVNEYDQYRAQLISGSSKLDSTKLLASIVYKNYYPDEYAFMHQQKGRIADCLDKKKDFVTFAKKERIEKGKELAQKDIEVKQASIHLSLKELRTLYMFEYLHEINAKDLNNIVIEGSAYLPTDIVESEALFEKLIGSQTVNISRSTMSRMQSITINFDDLQKRVSAIPYMKRKEVINDVGCDIEQTLADLELQEEEINNYTLQELLMKFNIDTTEEYKALNLVPMEEMFLRRGYISEDYYDYISYFHAGMITENDRQLLLEMKLDKKPSYSRKIDKIDNFMDKLPGYVFNTDSILNLQVVDWLARDSTKNKEIHMVVKRIKETNKNLKFLIAFNREKWQFRDRINKVYMHRYAEEAWNRIVSWDIQEDKDILRLIWFQWVPINDVKPVQLEWMNNNYGFISSHVREIGLEKATQLLSKAKVNSLDNSSPELLDNMVKMRAYVVNDKNLTEIYNRYTGEKIEVGAVTYAMLKKVDVEPFQEYMAAHINEAVRSLSLLKNEPEETQLELTNNDSLDNPIWYTFTATQLTLISDVSNVANDDRIKQLFEMRHIVPSWKNVSFYIGKFGMDNLINSFISDCIDDLVNSPLNVSLVDKMKLFRVLVLKNNMPLEDYKKLVTIFNMKVDETHRDELEDIDDERLSYLIAHGKVQYSRALRIWMEDKPQYADFMMRNKKKLLENMASVAYTPELAFRILEYNGFTDKQKRDFIPYFNDEVIFKSYRLADKMCQMLNQEHMDLDEKQQLALIKTSRDSKERVMYAACIIDRNISNHALVKSILTALGGDYFRMTINGKPKFDKNDWNGVLLTVLEEGGFISSTKPVNGQTMVNMKGDLW